MSAATKLHTARDHQLGLIAAHYGTTKAGAIERFIRSEQALGHIPAGLPGFEAVALAKPTPAVKLTIEGQELPPIPAKQAAGLSTIIEHLVVDRGRDAGVGVKLSDGRQLAIGRKGTAIVMRVLDAVGKPGEVSTMTFSMAGEFAGTLTAAAAEATLGARA